MDEILKLLAEIKAKLDQVEHNQDKVIEKLLDAILEIAPKDTEAKKELINEAKKRLQ